MAGGKVYQPYSVLEAAERRLRTVFDACDIVVVSYSGGKDSTVLLELARREAVRRGRQIYALFIDPEAQYAETIAQIERAILGDPAIVPYWLCLPLLWRNAVSVFQPHWRAWNPACPELWVRPVPAHECVWSDPALFPFYDENFGIDEVITEFPKWLMEREGATSYASLVAIRADESFHRYTAIKSRKRKHRARLGGKKIKWSTLDPKTPQVVNFYPIYDWRVEDVWKFIGDAGITYNRVYDRMYLAGVGPNDQRICQPYGDEQRRGLDQWAVIEPETWSRLLDRVAGVNFGALYARHKLLGYNRGLLPEGHTWKSYTFFLLSTLPAVVRERYLANFAISIEWYMKERYYSNIEEIPDDDTPVENPSGFNIPSWRKMGLSILKNDFWGSSLDIGVTKYPVRDIYGAVEERGRVVVRRSVAPFYRLLKEQYNAYIRGGVEAVTLDFTHPTSKGPLKARWKDI